MSLFDIFKIKKYKERIASLEHDNRIYWEKYNQLGIHDYEEIQKLIAQANAQYEELSEKLEALEVTIEKKRKEFDKLNKSTSTNSNKINKSAELIRAINNALQNPSDIDSQLIRDLDIYAPSVILNLQCMNLRELRKQFRDNDAQINKLLDMYSSRYTTKTNQLVYQLIVIGMRAELQNILTKLKYEKLDEAISNVKAMTMKYKHLAQEGIQTIYPTLSKFIDEIEYLFINAVKIEYNYYVKKEQNRQEQAAIRENMRQEAEERRRLAAEKKKIEQEESKYNGEIDKLKEQITSASDEEVEALNKRIFELQAQLSEVAIKKADIAKLANGKAGYVYVISNLGSFGDNVFKVGMTRRLEPQERIDELGSASVPFRFDVHSFIFSNDAVSLESKLHSILHEKRVNKVNLRKEFFYSTVDELEQLVNQIDPTAEFNKTMLATEFNQSQSTDHVYSYDEAAEYDDEDLEEYADDLEDEA